MPETWSKKIGMSNSLESNPLEQSCQTQSRGPNLAHGVIIFGLRDNFKCLLELARQYIAHAPLMLANPRMLCQCVGASTKTRLLLTFKQPRAKPSCACGRLRCCKETWTIFRAAKTLMSRSLPMCFQVQFVEKLSALSAAFTGDFPTQKCRFERFSNLFAVDVKAHQPTSKWS